MSFRINTNITALKANINTTKTSDKLTASLGNLSSGLRINKAADDASSMSIADSLRAQADSLGQAIANGNDAIGMLQTADNAMAEQIEIMEIIRVKSIQAANDSQTRQSRSAIQQDIMRLLEEFDNIANNTSFNGQKLLNGNFTNKHFQIGAYSNQTIDISIGNTLSNTLGHITYNTTTPIAYQYTNDFADAKWTFNLQYGSLSHEYVEFDFTGQDLLDKGLGLIAEQVNAFSSEIGVRLSANTDFLNSARIFGSNWGMPALDLEINGVRVATGLPVSEDDNDGLLRSAINNYTSITGVTASVEGGRLQLSSQGGLPIHIKANSMQVLGMAMDESGPGSATLEEAIILGDLTFAKQGSTRPTYTITPKNAAANNQKGIHIDGVTGADGRSKFEDNTSTGFETVNLRDFLSHNIDKGLSKAMGYGYVGSQATEAQGGVVTYEGAQVMIDISVVALKDLDKIRSDIGSVQNQIIATINNISMTQINVKAAESQLRDVDFALEAANFNKQNILMQSGSYSLAQANTIQQNVMRLLQ